MSLPASPTWSRAASAFVLAFALGSCAALPPMPPRQASQALDPAARTTLSERVAAERGPAGRSGLRVIDGGTDALATLMHLADSAERTLDLQYYAMLNDTSARVLMQRVRAAAERGVRVRLLLDDMNTAGTDDALQRLTRHPRIEVRLYNPMPSGRMSTITKILSSLHDAQRINSRMHNKAFIADNALAVTGGRNIGDPYFLQAEEANFVDLDVLVAGPVVRQLSQVFDRFWNSELAYPVHTVVEANAAAASAPLDMPDTLPADARTDVQRRLARAGRATLGLQWAPARLIADRPSKSFAQGEPSDAETMFDELGALLDSAQRDVLIVTPYFVPGVKGMALIEALRRRGVHVRILTAALAATDAPVVHVGYSKYRPRLLAAGVELYELRPEFAPDGAPRRGGVHSRTNLHSKAIVVDGTTLLVGSMNVDPRSDKHNTEMGLLVRSTPLAQRLVGIIDRVCRTGAYRVGTDEDGDLRWRYTERDGRTVTFDHEPRTSWFSRTAWRLLAPLAPEEML
jgi:phosphatidylserine/phosphatidylglycerophosphate/cardiolipin synthase-like enzyme